MSKTDAILSLVDPAAERALLGAILISGTLNEVVGIITKEDFQAGNHGTIYAAMLELYLSHTTIEPVTLSHQVQKHTRLENIGIGAITGLPYLTGLTTDTLYSYSAAHYAEQVHELATRRRLLSQTQKTAKDAYDRSVPVDDIIELGCQGLLSINGESHGRLSLVDQDLDTFSQDLWNKTENPTEIAGLPTGLIDVDKAINGLEPDRLYIVAARPGMGKTGYLLGIAHHLSIVNQYHGAFFSLEMGRHEVMIRLAARPGKLDIQALSRGKIIGGSGPDLDEGIRLLGAGRQRLWIDDSPALTPAALRARCIQLQLAGQLDYIEIDFLQLMSIPGAGSAYERASEAARELKNLAKALHLPVVAACQLSRSVEARGHDKRPLLSDLRDSGAIEEAADVVKALYRDEYYTRPDLIDPEFETKEKQDKKSKAICIILKNRSGPSNIEIPLYWSGKSASYWNAARPPDPLF